MNLSVRTIIDRCVVFAGLIGLWLWASHHYGFYWASSPQAVLTRIGQWAVTGELTRHASFTFMAMTIGFFLGAIPGTLLPFFLRRRPILTAILEPYMVAGYAIPKLALVPLLIIWFGVGIWPKVALVTALCFFISFFTTFSGIRVVSPQLVRMAEIAGANSGKVSRSIVFPATLPYIFTGIRVAIPFAVGGTVVSEMLSANQGIGYLIQASAMSFDSTGSFAGIFVLAIIVAFINMLFARIETAAFRWRPGAAAKKRTKETSTTA